MSLTNAIEKNDLGLLKQLISEGADLEWSLFGRVLDSTWHCSEWQSFRMPSCFVGGKRGCKQARRLHYTTSLCYERWVHGMHEGSDEAIPKVGVVILTPPLIYSS